MTRHYLNQGWPRCWWIHASQACMCYTLLTHIISSQFQDSLYKQLLKNMWFISHILQGLFTGTGQLPDCPSVSQSHQKNMGKSQLIKQQQRRWKWEQCVKLWDVLSRDTLPLPLIQADQIITHAFCFRGYWQQGPISPTVYDLMTQIFRK